MTCARREAGAHRPAPSASAGLLRRADARPGRRRARLFGLLPALALLAGALGLFGPAPAEAQTNPTVAFAEHTYNIAEVAGSISGTQYSNSVTVTVNISPALSEASSVTVVALPNSSAIYSTDYTVSGLTSVTVSGQNFFSGTLALPAGASSATFTVSAVADKLTDGRIEEVTLELRAISGAPYGLGARTNSAIRITDNSLPHTVSFSQASAEVTETGTVTVRLTVDPAVTGGVNIPLVSSGTFEPGDLFLPTNAFIGDGNTNSQLRITANDDSDFDDETVTVALGTLPAGYVAGSVSSLTVTIKDNDALVTLSAAPNPVPEGGQTKVTMTLSIPAPSDLTIPVTVTRGTAETGDYTAPGNNPITLDFATGQETADFLIDANQDRDHSDETLTVALGALPNTFVQDSKLGAGSPLSVTIADDDKPTIPTNASGTPTLSWHKQQYTVNESSDVGQKTNKALLTVLIAPPLPRASYVHMTENGSASSEANDFFLTAAAGVERDGTNAQGYKLWRLGLPAGVSSASFWIWGVADRTAEGNDNVVFTLKPVSGEPFNVNGAEDMTEVTIWDTSEEAPTPGACTPPTNPDPATGPGGGVPQGVEVVPGGPGQFDVRWRAAPGRAGTWNGYEVQYKLVNETWPPAGSRPGDRRGIAYAGGHSALIAGLTRGERYDVRVRNVREESYERTTCTADGDRTYTATRVVEVGGAWSATASGEAGTVVQTLPPQRARNVQVAADAKQQLTVTWEAPGSDGGSAITGYNVWYAVAGGTPSGSLAIQGADARTATITGLSTAAGYAGKDVTVAVAAVNAEGQGPAGRDLAHVYDVPDAPWNVYVWAERGEVRWTIAYERGAPVTKYRVRHRSGPSGTWSNWQELSAYGNQVPGVSHRRRLSVAGLTATSQARVQAYNAAGWGATGTWEPSVQGGAGATQTDPGRLRLPGLHANFFNLPAGHGGPAGKAVAMRVRFSVPVPATPAELRAALEVTGGAVKRVKRHAGRSDVFGLRLAPAGFEAMTVRLPARACGTEGAICTGYGQALAQGVEASIAGPPPDAVAFSVADARAKEGPGAKLRFAVTLDRAASAPVRVDYATADGTATAGEDYVADAGTLLFAPGVTKRTVRVALLDDAHDEGKETMKLRLSNPYGARIADGKATGTIRNSDPLQATWLGRFGRAAASDAIAAVTARFETPRDAGSHFTLGGHRLAFDGAGEAGPAPAVPSGADGLGWSEDPGASRTMDTRALLMGTSFRAVLGHGAVAQWTSWGQGASVSQFSGAAPGLSLSGEAATGSLGMDYERGSLLAGFAMTHSLGEGTAHGAGRSYAMGSTVTTALPYARLALTERISAWGLAGTGSGALTLELDGAAHRHRADLSMMLAAAGVRGELLAPVEAGGFALAVKADAFWVRTESDAVSSPGVENLAAARADATRLRAVLDGSRTFALASGRALTPSLALGVRHDGGDASTGTGLELGAGLGFADPARGLDMALRVHGLAARAEDGYREWGVSGSLKYVPGAAGRGLTASLVPSYGADPGGSERLWMLPDASRLAANDDAPLSSRLDAELGYGLPVFGGGFTGTPNVGFGLSDTAREVRLGWRLTPAAGGATGFELKLDLTRREAADDGAEHGVMLRSRVNW